MGSRCIVNCGVGYYLNTNRSTLSHCQGHCPDAALRFHDQYPAGCPQHHEMMYAFKIFALAAAIAEGFQSVLWMDCSFMPTRSIEPLWAEVERDGWYIAPQEDAVLGRWCSDSALTTFGISRDTARTIPLVYSGLVGLNMATAIGAEIWARWKALYETGCFNGAHRNVPGGPTEPWGAKWQGHVSDDPTVEGHRHDESALSFVLYQLGLKPKRLNFLTYESPDGFIGHHLANI